MIGGQVLDMGAEHRKISLDELRLLQKLKTGCLLRAACELGCAAAGATDEDTLALSLIHISFCAPERTRSRLTRLPSSAPMESITILLPAPVSPESTVKPLSSSMSARSMTAMFSMWSNCSIAALSLAYFRISLA